MICGFDNAIGVSVHVSHCTLHLFLGSWLEKGDSSFKVDDCGISRGNFQPTWHVQVLYDTSLALARSSPTRRYTGKSSLACPYVTITTD